MSTIPEKTMNSLLEKAIQAALKAGEAILRIYDDPASDFEIEHKADNSPLTVADRKSNDIILDFLKETPYPVISEESRAVDYAVRKEWQTVWIVDPLDGTKEFIKRNGEFTVNIALVYNGNPILGVIYIPVKKRLYYGTLQQGAFRADEIGHPSEITFEELERQAVRLPLERKDPTYTVVASRSHLTPETEAFIREIEKKQAPIRLTSIGSSIKICLIAEGSADVYPRFAPTMEWDTAAGHAIVKAAHKEIFREDGRTPLTYNKENLQNPWFIVQ